MIPLLGDEIEVLLDDRSERAPRERNDLRDHHAAVSVRDRGMGVEPHEQREIFQNNQGNFEEIRKQRDALSKAKMEKVNAILTADQRAQWQQMKAEHKQHDKE